jgi:hypothetical protein
MSIFSSTQFAIFAVGLLALIISLALYFVLSQPIPTWYWILVAISAGITFIGLGLLLYEFYNLPESPTQRKQYIILPNPANQVRMEPVYMMTPSC